MFTGIVEELGTVDAVDGGRVRVAATTVLDGRQASATRSRSTAAASPSSTRATGWWEADVVDETLDPHHPRRPASRATR